MGKQIYTTKDYSKFKKLEGNRDVPIARVEIIKKSIESVGYVTNPIIVNENFEVIEGQGRLQALKELELPVDYIIEDGCGIKQCIALNMRNTNWKLTDFIKSYANRGYVGYKRLCMLMEKYQKYGITTLATAVKLISKFDNDQIKNGTLEISEEEYNDAIDRLNWLEKITPYCKSCAGELNFLYQSLLICKEFDGVDMDKLKERVISQNSVMLPFASIPDCMQSLEQLYNKNRPEKFKVYIFTEYRKWLANNRPAAAERIKNNSYRKESNKELI